MPSRRRRALSPLPILCGGREERGGHPAGAASVMLTPCARAVSVMLTPCARAVSPALPSSPDCDTRSLLTQSLSRGVMVDDEWVAHHPTPHRRSSSPCSLLSAPRLSRCPQTHETLSNAFSNASHVAMLCNRYACTDAPPTHPLLSIREGRAGADHDNNHTSARECAARYPPARPERVWQLGGSPPAGRCGSLYCGDSHEETPVVALSA